MDDMWDTNVWDDVRRAFPDDCNGSKVLITTRDLDVASYIDSSKKPHNIPLMTVDQSWTLLKESVFGKDNCPLELEKIGKQIAEKCKGLPLAIVVISGVLSKLKQNRGSWIKISRSVSEAVNSNSDEQFSDILSLSYMHLPPLLRHCFLYTSCFPEDYEIDVSKLIRLWEAEDFLISDQSKHVEELGYEYLENSVRRNLVLIEKKSYDGKIKTVKIHDVLRDLCIRKSRDENFHHIVTEFKGSFPLGIENSCRLSICSNISGVIPNIENSPVRTILLFNHWAFDSWKCLRHLWVVDALTLEFTSSGYNTSVRHIGELIHLRYLAFSCEGIKRTLGLVSESLCRLQNLHTLIVKVISKFPELRMSLKCRYLDDEDIHASCMKFELWTMPKLRHLILLDGFIPDPFTQSFQETSVLENLARPSQTRQN